MDKKVVVCIMGQNCEKFLPMCLESVKDADDIIYCDGGSTDNSIIIAKEKYGCAIINNEYKQDDPAMNGKQRNFYLQYLKENYKDWIALCLDADEVVDDFSNLKEWINKFGDILIEKYPAISVKMRHFHGDLGREDAVTKEHFVLNRLFYVCDELEYPEVEHPVLFCKGKDQPQGYVCRDAVIWHLAHIQHCFEIKKRYEKNLKHSNIHSKEFLDNWYLAHLTNRYPTTAVDPVDIPEVIWRCFGINKDIFYFANRNLEMKHFIMTSQWSDYYRNKYIMPLNVGMDIIEFGCGKGPFGYAFKTLNRTNNYKGIELSDYATQHAFVEKVEQGDILKYKTVQLYDVCLLFDILEHLNKEELDKALENVKDIASLFIISVPVIGDPNLEADKTHKIKETKEWWTDKFSKYFNILETPKDWLFANQIIIGEIKNDV